MMETWAKRVLHVLLNRNKYEGEKEKANSRQNRQQAREHVVSMLWWRGETRLGEYSRTVCCFGCGALLSCMHTHTLSSKSSSSLLVAVKVIRGFPLSKRIISNSLPSFYLSLRSSPSHLVCACVVV